MACKPALKSGLGRGRQFSTCCLCPLTGGGSHRDTVIVTFTEDSAAGLGFPSIVLRSPGGGGQLRAGAVVGHSGCLCPCVRCSVYPL